MSVLGVRVHQPGRPSKLVRVDKNELTIGREPQCDVVLPDNTVSRLHAVAGASNGVIWIRDAGSRNGISIAGTRVEHAHLYRGMRVQIQGFELELELLESGEQTVASLAPPRPFPPAPPPVAPEPPAAPEPPRGAGPALHDLQAGDDLEDADLDVTPPFSLVDELRAHALPSLEGLADVVLEAVEFHDGELRQVHRLRPGSTLSAFIDDSEYEIARFDEDGRAVVHQLPGTEFRSWSRALQAPDPHVVASGGRCVSRLKKNEIAELSAHGTRWLVYLAPAPPRLPEDDDLAALVPGVRYSAVLGGASVVGHLLLFLVVLPALAFVASRLLPGETPADADVDRFAEIALDIPEAEPEKPKPTPTPRAQKKAPPRRSQQKVAQRQTPAPPPRQQPHTSQQASAGITGAMGKLNVRFNASAPLLASATNLRGVRIPGGGGYKVSAVAVKGSGVVNGRPGGAFGNEDVGTLNGQILNAMGGAGGIARKGKGKVRATVAQPPPRRVGVKGQLDQALIAAVVNKHIREVRHCYEKELLRDSTLSGKILVEWVIDEQGRVVAVRTKFSSLRRGAVASCVNARVRTWHFPKPKGGRVIVNYPFMFESVGF